MRSAPSSLCIAVRTAASDGVLAAVVEDSVGSTVNLRLDADVFGHTIENKSQQLEELPSQGDRSRHRRQGIVSSFHGCPDTDAIQHRNSAEHWSQHRTDYRNAGDQCGQRSAKCETCHTGPVETFKPGSTCIDCHAKDDVHKTRLGSDCKSCHAEEDWKKSTHQHDQGRFPLIGGHRLIECADCHRTQLFADIERECVSCHLKDDPHVGRYGEQCARCHSARDWKAWDFSHASTDFALTGAHPRLQCASCHTAQAGKQLSGECSSCHSKDDVHDGGFGRQCARCHSTSSFTEVAPRVPGKKP